MQILIAFDMDDTLTQTNKYIVDKLRLIYSGDDEESKRKLGVVNELDGQGCSTMNFPKDISDDIFTEIIKVGTYMLDCEPTPLVQDLPKLKSMLIGKGIDPIFVVCTHRGFSLYGEVYTAQWLDKYGKLELFNDVLAIKGKDHPNKIDYLKAEFPNLPIVLIDDNPFHAHDGDAFDHCPEVVIYDKINKYPAYEKQNTFSNYEGLVSDIVKRLGVEDIVEELGEFGEA